MKFIELDKMWSTRGSATTVDNCSSEIEPTVVRAGDGDALLSVDWFGLDATKPPDWTAAADETGDKLPLGVSESVQPTVSEPIADNTDVGDWLSRSETEKFGDADLIGCSVAEISLGGITSFLG